MQKWPEPVYLRQGDNGKDLIKRGSGKIRFSADQEMIRYLPPPHCRAHGCTLPKDGRRQIGLTVVLTAS